VRLRLTLLYGGLFLVSGAALLATTYVLVRNATDNPVVIRTQTTAAPAPPGSRPGLPLPSLRAQAERDRQRAQQAADRQHADMLRQLLLQSGLALGLMAVVSIGLGWVVAGRVLRPVRTITAATRRISRDSLHERLALAGPDDELKELADTIDDLLARLERAFDAQRRFVANASHELRTPLAMMRTSLDVASGKPGPVPDELRALDGKLREGLDQADQLLESFLLLARAEHGSLREPTTVSLPHLVTTALEAWQAAISDASLSVDQTLDEVRVRGSEALLARMVGNLVDNAIRHNQVRGWIRIKTEGKPDHARLLVENGGERLDPVDVAELAQPFRRLASERTVSPNGSVGLGLSIVAAIAEAHGGNVRLDARAEGGLRVVLELPRATAPAVARETA
jgi:signal transduction histidine kinase